MTSSEEQHLPQHVAIIMDGNNRFAKKNQMQKGDGHREGKNVLDPVVEHCKRVGVRALTVFAFSSENWNRPQYEVDLLMQLLKETIYEQLPRMEKFNIALRFIGDRSRLSDELRDLMQEAERKTAAFDSMTLSIAISYGGMWDMAHAAKSIAEDVVAGKIQTDQINVDLFDKYVSLNDLPAVDLLIRTGGDYRLSNFLLWQAAYAELYFTDTLWPEFTIKELDHAFRVFSGRERRFGKTSEQIQQAKIEN
ncbi:di-trans,poly-cis-decaprenylcistransferase [Acinetobacter suaedae]|uniref:Ditrans,polycis-undecaprenyl-diphosphate synthase ((2E,6E)-farnesyl-diphosphate specific) n=1 Tax=Acinetobacter suaedae TaxID=2609668 RepID=A0A5P1USN9_9GAMM|nr:polyprenyl diphosphate synthase [Acinetobacter sp. C16S1]QER39745.1 di-trans,poly-cis-decaprenylcistransferase [Acinetobacter sp. C16S1]